MRPGRHPMRELARAAFGNGRAEIADLLTQLIRAEEEAVRTLLVVDQLEEVWTACEDAGERAAFLDTLVELLSDDRSTSVVLAVRADYVGEVAEHAESGCARWPTAPCSSARPPAPRSRAPSPRRPSRAGLSLEEGLAETIVSDAGAEPGLLPLLSVAMTQVWERRDGGLR